MAACVRRFGKVFIEQRTHLFASSVHYPPNGLPAGPHKLSNRYFAAIKPAKKEVEQNKKEKQRKAIEEKRADLTRHKPYGLTAWIPTDDVYLTKYYPKPVYEIDVAIQKLKKFQELDFTDPKQYVYINLRLDMKLEKKKKVDSFVSTINLPHPLKEDLNKVLVFTENPEETEVAEKNGASFVGGEELVQKILDDEISADFYIAVPAILPKIMGLKNKLRKVFPKSKRGSVGTNIPKMLEHFKTCSEYMVENDCYIKTKIGMLDMEKDKIIANMSAIIKDVCSHKPASYGPFIERGIICSATSEALRFKVNYFLPEHEDVKET
ncbi:39S ribosomal protein L1, mitochondrial [Polypterus senegalus]|uniref:39S ribosomal protein L1, mitochondrial n=1 Tax=Polypterus senegalus TaxID=55291 RepID=UPI00196419F0|nr:39S ribosomal protein L1, mitochondrial [Polypterus senegalus]